ncbi:MAG: hypothetical protein Q4E56_00505 [Pseudomonadota bacterium]|nr:hypothetical protein [Pseudomonadota bacterium]
MPLNNRRNHATRNKIIIWSLIIILVVLMIISFPAPQNMTEVVLYP